VAIVIVVVAMQLCVPAFTRPFYRALAGQFAFTSARLRSMPDSNSDTGIFVRRNGRAFPFRVAYVAQDAESMLAELERVSLPGQRLFVGPADLRLTSYSDTYIYHMLPQLRPATYFLEMNPASANAPNSRLARDVESADWLVLNRVWNFLDESNRSTLLGPDAPNEVVRQKFDLWAEIGPYLLFRNKRLRNAVMLPPS
jgi:hypothetical protein